MFNKDDPIIVDLLMVALKRKCRGANSSLSREVEIPRMPPNSGGSPLDQRECLQY